MIDFHSPYKYDPANLSLQRELRARRDEDPESLTTDERRVLQWLTFSQTNFLLKGLRNEDSN